MGMIIYAVGGILSLVCAIMVLIPLFKKEGVGLGILGIFCGIYTYIWGWMKSKELGLKNIMLGWSVGIVLMIVGAVLTAKQAIESSKVPDAEFQNAMQDAKTRAEQGQPAPTPP